MAAEANGWLAELKRLETDYRNALDTAFEGSEHGRPMPRNSSPIDRVDHLMSATILGVGLLLLVGLFTRSACLVGAAFLLSVVSMQPFWLSDAAPTYNQWVELVALLMLSTTAVGRWGGLDYFIHNLLSGSPRSMKGQTDVS